MKRLLLGLVIVGLVTSIVPVQAQEEPEVSAEEATVAAEEKMEAEETESPVPQAIEEAPPEYLYPGILPDHPLYFLESLLYKVKGFFVFGDVAKARWSFKMADKRAAEAKGLADKGKEYLAVKASEKAVAARDEASEHLQAAQTAGKDVEELIEKMEAISTRQQAALDYVLEKVPESAQEAIQRAKENSARGHARAIEALKKKAEEKEEKLEEKLEKETEELEEEEEAEGE